MKSVVLAWAGLLVLAPAGWAQQAPSPSPSPLESYRKLQFPPKEANFSNGWQERVALEYDVINLAELAALRAALKDKDPFVRSLAARALGIRADKDSADALADLAKTDPEYMVRVRAVESLGYLKMKTDVIELAKKDANGGVSWAAARAAGQAKADTDYAVQVRQAFAAGIKREAMGAAKLGQPAPDFSAQTTDGKPFQISTVLGKKPIAIYFAAFDG